MRYLTTCITSSRDIPGIAAGTKPAVVLFITPKQPGLLDTLSRTSGKTQPGLSAPRHTEARYIETYEVSRAQRAAATSHTTRPDVDADTCARHSRLPQAGAARHLPPVVSTATKIQQTFSSRAIPNLQRSLSAERYVTAPTTVKRRLLSVGHPFHSSPASSLFSFLCITPTTCVSLSIATTANSPIMT